MTAAAASFFTIFARSPDRGSDYVPILLGTSDLCTSVITASVVLLRKEILAGISAFVFTKFVFSP